MAKQSGLGDNLYVAGNNLSGDIGSLGRIGGGPATLEVTGIDKSAPERIGGLRDGAMSYSAFFNDAAGQAHLVLRPLPTADVILTYCRGTALGSPAAAMVAKQINYDPTRDSSGNLTFAVEAQSNGFGLEWGQQLTAGRRTDAAAANGAGVDYGVGPTAFGLQAWLHVFAFTGTSVTVKLQESADNGAADPWVDVVGGGFTAASAVTSERIQTARGQTVKRWLRAVTTGVFTNAVFAVMAARNDVSVVF